MQLQRIESFASEGVALDTETHLVQPGLLAPPLVCGSVAILNVDALEALEHAVQLDLEGQHTEAAAVRAEFHDCPVIDADLLSKPKTLELFLRVLRDPKKIITGANIAFDLLVLAHEWARRGVDVMPDIFRAFNEERIYDLQIAEALHAIACGHLNDDPRTGKQLVNPETGKRSRYSLAMCVDLVLGRTDAKQNDEWRMRYAELEHVPMADWPETAKEYPIDDARNTLECSLAQCGHLPKTTPQHNWGTDGCIDCGATRFGEMCVARRLHRNLHDLANQVRAAFALHLGAAWGFHVDQSKVDVVEAYALARRAAGISPFKDAGIIRPEGSVNEAVLKKAVARAYGAERTCVVCAGTGKVLAPNPRLLRCPVCKGKSAPWRWAGRLRAASISSCDTCGMTGKVIDTRHLIGCIGPDGEKTCDGTGLQLTAAVPRSDTGCISTSADTLHESGDEFVTSYADFTKDSKWLKDYVPFLRRGRRQLATGGWFDIPLTLKPNSILESGRVSYLDHIQTFPRWPGFKVRATQQYIPSFRECIVARPGHVLSSEDFRAGELVTGAQSNKWLVGFSDLGVALLTLDTEGKPTDVHAQLAARVLGMSYEEFIRQRKIKRFSDTRQASKPFMFGKPGGMGTATIVVTQRRTGPDTPHPTGPALVEDENGDLVPGYKGLRFCLLMGGEGPCGARKLYEWNDKPCKPACAECLHYAEELGQHWRSTYREYTKVFRFVSECVDSGQLITREMLARWPHLQPWFRAGQRLAPGEIMQHVTGRVRGGLAFCDAANGFFQGLLADIAKQSYWQVTTECYDHTYKVPDMLYDNSIRSEYAGIRSPLFGSRSVGFFHDEFLNEHPAEMASDGAKRVSEIMRDVMRWFCPDYADAAEAEPTLMLAWDKRATKISHRGKIQVWTQDHNPKSCVECLA